MMSAELGYRASTNHVWSVRDRLGNGAFGTIFRGINKINGGCVAVKAFNKHATAGTNNQQEREFEILKKLDHPNVVRMIDKENEVCTCPNCLRPNGIGAGGSGQSGLSCVKGREVMIMELCTGGSLYMILERPEDCFGLAEPEFLLLFRCLVGGMKYLRDNNVVHRDIKPSNILRTISADGRTVYKLCDFGAAKVLLEDEPYLSLVGTEEYLHPDVYKRALLQGSQLQFGATTELWSIGVTLYQAATGELPFKPFAGRKSKDVMHRMTSAKPPGVIAAFQEEDGGTVRWRWNLPPRCQLSSGLRPLLENFLAHLFETQADKLWSFETFFAEAESFLSRTRLDVFCSFLPALVSVYSDQNTNFMSFSNNTRERIKTELNQRGLAVKDPSDKTPTPIFLIDEAGNMLSPERLKHFLQRRSSDSFKATADNNEGAQIFAFLPKAALPCAVDLEKMWMEKTLPKTPLFISPDQATMDQDVHTARVCVATAYWIQRDLAPYNLMAQNFLKSISSLKLFVEQKLSKAEACFARSKEILSFQQRNLRVLNLSLSVASPLLEQNATNGFVEHATVAAQMIAKKSDSAAVVARRILEIEKDFSVVRGSSSQLLEQFRHVDSVCGKLLNDAGPSTTDSLKFLIAAMTETLMLFGKDRSMHVHRVTHVNEYNYHVLQKQQLVRHWHAVVNAASTQGQTFQLLKTISTHCQPLIGAYVDLLFAVIGLEENVTRLQDMIEAFDGSLNETVQTYETASAELAKLQLIGKSAESSSVPKNQAAPQAMVVVMEQLRIATNPTPFSTEQDAGLATGNHEFAGAVPSKDKVVVATATKVMIAGAEPTKGNVSRSHKKSIKEEAWLNLLKSAQELNQSVAQNMALNNALWQEITFGLTT